MRNTCACAMPDEHSCKTPFGARCSLQRSYFYLNCILVRSEIRHWEKFCAVRWLIGWMDRWRWMGLVQRKCWLRRCTLCHASEVTCIFREKCKFDLWCLSDWKYKWAHTVRYLWLCRIQIAIHTLDTFCQCICDNNIYNLQVKCTIGQFKLTLW